MPSALHKRILAQLWPYRRLLGIGALGLVVTAIFQNRIPILLKHSIDQLDEPNAQSQILRLVLWIILFAIAQAIFRTLSRVAIFNAARRLEYDLRSRLFRHLLRLPMSYFSQQPVGAQMARLTNDTGNLRVLYGLGTLQVINTLVVVAITFPSIFPLSPTLTILVMLLGPLIYWLNRPTARQIFSKSRENQDLFGEISEHLHQTFGAIALLKSFMAFDFRLRTFRVQIDRYASNEVRLAQLRMRYDWLLQFSTAVGTVGLFTYGGAQVINGEMTLGDLVAFSAYLAILIFPIRMMGWVVPVIQRGIASLERIEQVFSQLPESGYANAIDATLVVRPLAVKAQGVRFRYSDDKDWVLDGINLEIRAGERVAIVGPIASGKSTFLKILSGLYAPSAGHIWLGEQEVTSATLPTLRPHVAYASQEAPVFSESLEENILFSPNRRMTLPTAAELSQLGNDLNQFADGWKTLVGPQGVTLSGGQRQRTAISRTLIKPAGLYLFDDPFSQLDTRTARDVAENLITSLSEATLIIVQQRLVEPERFNRIIVLREGKVASQGTHAELLRSDSSYAASYAMQILSEETSGAKHA